MSSSFIRMLSLIVALMFAFGCSKNEPASGDGHEHGLGDGHDHGEEATHGSKSAVPGSYEDWCGEHSVPESKCTRCNASLVAAFKATGDWCAEHGLPESQCVKCDPSRKMVRPTKPAGK